MTWTICVGDERVEVFPIREDRVINAEKIIRVGNATYVKTATGHFLASAVHGSFYLTAEHGMARGCIEAAVKFGLLSKKVKKEVLAAIDRDRAVSRKQRAANDVLDNIEAAGIELTANQLRRLRMTARKGR